MLEKILVHPKYNNFSFTFLYRLEERDKAASIAIVEAAITIWEAIQKEAKNKSVTKSKAKRLRAITLKGAIGIIPILEK